MELNEAIAHAREVAENWKSQQVNCVTEEGRCKCQERAAEHEQLADWLEELKARREADKWNVIRTEADLPKESDFYLVTIADKYLTYVNTLFFMKSAPDMWEHDKRVIAWKPLPKPYESEAENE